MNFTTMDVQYPARTGFYRRVMKRPIDILKSKFEWSLCMIAYFRNDNDLSNFQLVENSMFFCNPTIY